jgi:stage V sporulation protein B
MTKQADKFVKGAIILSFAGLIAKLITAFYRIPLAYLTGDEGVGYYHTVYPFYALLTATALIGIPNTVSKLIAEEIAVNDYKKAHKTFKYSLILTSLIGVLVSIAMFLGGNYLIRICGWNEGTIYVIWGLAISPLFIGITGAIRGYFQGLQIMGPSAITQIIENISKVLIGISLVALMLNHDYEIPKAVGGAAIGASSGFIFSSIYMTVSYIRKKSWFHNKILEYNNGSNISFRGTARKILVVALPVTIVSAAYSIMNLIDSLTIYKQLEKIGRSSIYATQAVGQMGKAFSIINVPLTISVALAISIVPAVSAAVAKGDKLELSRKIEKAIRFAILLALPASAGVFVLSKQLMYLLYPSNPAGYIYLKLFSICLIFMVLGQTLAGILQGISKYYIPLVSLIFAVIVKIIVNINLVSSDLECVGAAIGSIMYYIILVIINYIAVRRNVKLSINIINVYIKPIISTCIMAILVNFIYKLMYEGINNNLVATIISIIIGVITYFTILVIIKGISKEEVSFIAKKYK